MKSWLNTNNLLWCVVVLLQCIVLSYLQTILHILLIRKWDDFNSNWYSLKLKGMFFLSCRPSWAEVGIYCIIFIYISDKNFDLLLSL